MQEKPAGDAWLEAQRIALAPIAFQAARLLRDLGILAALREHRAGLTIGEIVETVGISRYGVVVLIEAGLAAGLVRCDEDRFVLTPTGFVLLTDESTRVNMNVVQECCYQSAYYLEDSIHEG
ncbi:MAG: SAM-dependent methyltransferase, partial [Gammaproteobacteria bacterium]|nr:MarR family transcriptional regulator [Gammaproteobacteria bacterium]NIP88667.1 MarR family transcriptional regulator [Gammaproteobacteria bacterium]NIR23388.1 MarR family transcriptional regulator [Gammaproteobacteria bacterium]NIS04959.1 MarR family transcriptional regulator [Gammaproteobacteria bacterium]NIU40237.1 SAM-dependent methyltransferase [Gammaproteobacteria bacterium]